MNEQTQHISHEEFAKKLSRRFKRLRKERGLSQERTAYTAFVSPFTYLKYERGESNIGTPMNPKLYTLLALADAFGVSILDLLDVDDSHTEAYERYYANDDDDSIYHNPEAFSKALGDHLQRLRWDRNLSQEDVARIAGITYNHYHFLEKGESRPGSPANPWLSTLISIANAFGVSLIDLLTVDD